MMCLLLGIGDCYDGVVDFGVEEDTMAVFILPALFPETHNLPQLFLGVEYGLWADLKLLSHFLLQTICLFE